MQTRTLSLIESILNTASGYLLSLAIQAAVFPAMGFPVTFAQSNMIAVIFTVASIIRCYVWRRAFNRWR